MLTLKTFATLRAVVVSTTILSMISACGAADSFKKNDKKSAKDEAGAGQYATDCLYLGGEPLPPDYGTPAQNNGYDQGGKKIPIDVPGRVVPYTPAQGPGQQPPPPNTGNKDYDVVVPQPTPPTTGPGQQPPYEPGKPGQPTQPTAPCKTNPGQGQTPGQVPGGKDYTNPTGTEPQPYPTQTPIVPEQCGKDGKYCDNGGPGQYPAQTSSGQSYDRKDLDSCLAAFRQGGYDTKGMWTVVVKEAKSVNVLSNSSFLDKGTVPSIVIIKSVNVLGGMAYELMNPNALYCIQSVSVLQNTHITSCRQNNVVFGKDVSVLSGTQNQVVDCR